MRHRFNPRAVVFDLDGTLVDSAPEIAAALNGSLGRIGLEPFPIEQVHGFIGGGALAAIRKALASRDMQLETDALDRVLADFMQVYAEVSEQGNGLYPGAVELLAELKERGFLLGLCTNKADPITRIATRALGIDHYFHTIVGARDDLAKKPAADPLLKALSDLGVAVAEGLMIGDSRADVGCARAAGCPIIAVTYGYAHVPIAELAADHVVEHLSEIAALLPAAARARAGAR